MKKGISLIVLVITIIVMIIIAGAIIISLSNSNVIDKADEAVKATNDKSALTLAALAKSEYMMSHNYSIGFDPTAVTTDQSGVVNAAGALIETINDKLANSGEDNKYYAIYVFDGDQTVTEKKHQIIVYYDADGGSDYDAATEKVGEI